jgi:FMN phosphatase YigB (HAD superfamily)
VTAEQIDIVLFDLGGVLVDFGGVGPMKELAGIDTDDELWQRWLSCPWVRRFERGHCSPEDFAVGMVDEWSLRISSASFLAAFESWPGGTMPGAADLVDDVRRILPVGCLSNTNALHWEAHFAQWPILSSFDFRFLSFEMGMVKPDQELFFEVAHRLDTPPERLLFLDDNLRNVEAASASGLRTRHVRGAAEARRALVESGIIAE